MGRVSQWRRFEFVNARLASSCSRKVLYAVDESFKLGTESQEKSQDRER